MHRHLLGVSMRLISMVCVLWLCAALPAQARNILSEQNEAANARDAYRDAVTKHEDLQARIKAQQALIEKEQAKLKQLQAEEVTSRNNIDNAKTLFEQKSKALDEAWKQRQNY